MGGLKLTNKNLPNDPAVFPPPVRWMSWVAEAKYARHADGRLKQDANGQYILDMNSEGKIRYHYDRMDARKSLMWLGRESKWRREGESGTFFYDWAVYEWVNDEWVLRGEGLRGQKRSENPFFDRKNINKAEQVHVFDRITEEKAIESILKAAKKEE
jgi:hypothetical protein